MYPVGIDESARTRFVVGSREDNTKQLEFN